MFYFHIYLYISSQCSKVKQKYTSPYRLILVWISIVSIVFQRKPKHLISLSFCSSAFILNGNISVSNWKASIFLFISIYIGFICTVSYKFHKQNKHFYLNTLFLCSASWNLNATIHLTRRKMRIFLLNSILMAIV